MPERPVGVDASRSAGWILACCAALLGVLYAAVSGYWAAGGTALLGTVGGSLEKAGRDPTAGLVVVVWVTVALKLTASGVGLLASAQPPSLGARFSRLARRSAWVVAVVLVLYGGVLTIVGLLVQVGLVPASAHADHRALRWHALLWDPWFLLWGVLLATALVLTRRRPGPGPDTTAPVS